MQFSGKQSTHNQFENSNLQDGQIAPESVLANRIRYFIRTGDGGALVEFAVIAPLLLALVTGIFSLGFALTIYLQLNNAVDVGARTVAVIRATNSDGTTPDPCAAAYTAISNAGPTLTASQITLSFSFNGTSYPKTKTCTSAEANILAGKNAQVTASYPYTLMLFGWKPQVLTMNSQTTELMQ